VDFLGYVSLIQIKAEECCTPRRRQTCLLGPEFVCMHLEVGVLGKEDCPSGLGLEVWELEGQLSLVPCLSPTLWGLCFFGAGIWHQTKFHRSCVAPCCLALLMLPDGPQMYTSAIRAQFRGESEGGEHLGR
jgi:hypothetical protein